MDATHLSEMLSKNKRINILNLSFNQIRMKNLANPLKYNETLKKLNNIKDTRLKFSSEALKYNNSFESISIVYNSITKIGFHHLIESIKQTILSLKFIKTQVGCFTMKECDV